MDSRKTASGPPGLAFSPSTLLLLAALAALAIVLGLGLVILPALVRRPRRPFPAEKHYQTVDPGGRRVTRALPCWHDRWRSEQQLGGGGAASPEDRPNIGSIEPPEVELTVVVPAYNEEARILPALEDMVRYCDEHFGRPAKAAPRPRPMRRKRGPADKQLAGYEILVVNDGSTDGTADVVLDFAARLGLHDVVRLVTLAPNRGKGGGVAHGFRHARGAYVAFADADGASRFSDLGRLMDACDSVADGANRGVAIGSRASLVGSDAVVKRSAIRNLLMHSFHFVLKILTPAATSRIGDTQCGFKLFSRAALPHIVPYMQAEGWIFDIEMLMLAESAPAAPVLNFDGDVIGKTNGIKVAEVPIEWHEVEGSKMNLVHDSVVMLLGLGRLRASWMLGVYRRRLT